MKDNLNLAVQALNRLATEFELHGDDLKDTCKKVNKFISEKQRLKELVQKKKRRIK